MIINQKLYCFDDRRNNKCCLVSFRVHKALKDQHENITCRKERKKIMKAALHTLGCKVNSYETQAIREQLEELGFEITDFDGYADIYVINTCSVTSVAAGKSRQMISKARKLNPSALIVATGCYAQESGCGFKNPQMHAKPHAPDLIRGADLIFGNNEKSHIAAAVYDYFYASEKNSIDPCRAADLTFCREFEQQRISDFDGHVRAYVKIQDGCDRFCSYCVIPYLRGRSRSRDYDSIINEVKQLARSGFKEIVLTGIDMSTFKITGDPASSDIALITLIEDISRIEGIERIRLGSLELSIITDEWASRAGRCAKLCPQFHLSLQSGSDSVLKRMNRHYSSRDYYDAVCLLRKYFDQPAITTDIIVGFPGESEEEFLEAVDFVKKVGFARSHVFPFSARKGTKADKMPDQLNRTKKAERVRSLMAVTDRLSEIYEEEQKRSAARILVEEISREKGQEYCIGYSEKYIRYKFVNDRGYKINDIVEK